MNCNSHWMDCVYTLAVSFLYGGLGMELWLC